MDRVIDVAASDRIVVDVFQLLPHHFVALNHLRMTTLLPKLIISVGLVLGFEAFQLSEDLSNVLCFERR